MLVIQQVKLIERRARDLPVMLLVQIAQRHGIDQHLVQDRDTLDADFLVQRNRVAYHRPVRLDFPCMLMKVWPCTGKQIVMTLRSVAFAAAASLRARCAHEGLLVWVRPIMLRAEALLFLVGNCDPSETIILGDDASLTRRFAPPSPGGRGQQSRSPSEDG